MPLNRRAVALISGGLDSALAIYLVKRQGIDITALHFPSFFAPLDLEDEGAPVRVLARQLDVPLVLIPKGMEFLEVIRNPRYGHGKNINPCIDCRIDSFVRAKAFMEEIGASFLVTGEVSGQRPMSQRRDAMRLIDKRSGCEGLVLRPLSAKVLPLTRPETEGIVDRDRLLDIAGRGRKVQLKLAQEIGLTGFSAPAGGCLLTDPGFARRLRDLLTDKQDVNTADLELLSIGRHIRVRPGLKLVVSRTEIENGRIEEIAPAETVFFPMDFPGPTVVVLGVPTAEEETLVAGIVRRYSKESRRGEAIRIRDGQGSTRVLSVNNVAQDDWIAAHIL
ncbi:MAG: tRNA 4-thiouridine(8) synthase ThiI [Desulfomonile tiedjei]|nr:tRNA 4-thiouridine(8) synthase ThiI [Desulfomonile tiedjei]